MNKEQQATNLITVELLDSLTYGDAIEVINGYYLYHYENDNFIVLNDENDEEIFCVLYNTEANEIIFEKL